MTHKALELTDNRSTAKFRFQHAELTTSTGSAHPPYYGKLTPTSDFTFYAHSSDIESLPKKAFHGECTGFLDDVPIERGRMCACSSYRGRFVSITIRKEGDPLQTTTKAAHGIDVVESNDSWCCSNWGKPDGFLLETPHVVETLWQLLWPHPAEDHRPTHGIDDTKGKRDQPHGLVVFSGSTNCAKSDLARAFSLRSILHSLRTRNDVKDRLPHLITFEDPCETWTASSLQSPPRSADEIIANKITLDTPARAAELTFCFTPRECKQDVPSLEVALRDAKRQTPTCFYVGEVRSPDDWKHIIEFAGSGHLIVTTTHASRLSETVGRILRARNARTAADRRNTGASIAACVHLRPARVTLDTANKSQIILPSVWIRRGAALSSLVADGLSSITPNGDFVLSRHQFVERASKYISRRALHNVFYNARALDLEELLQQ